MKLLCISGGGTKFSTLAGMAYNVVVDQKYDPSVYAGVSSGALVSFLLVFKRYETLKAFANDFKMTDFFDYDPKSLRGVLQAITRIGKGSLFTNQALYNNIRNAVSESHYEEFRKSSTNKKLYSGVVNEKGNFELINVFDYKYEDAIKWIVASTTIPTVFPKVFINNKLYFDGGLRHHNPAPRAIAMLLLDKDTITECVCLYSRAKNSILKPRKNRILENIIGSFDTAILSISESDEFITEIYNKYIETLTVKSIYMPEGWKAGTFEHSPSKIKEWYKLGYEQAAKIKI